MERPVLNTYRLLTRATDQKTLAVLLFLLVVMLASKTHCASDCGSITFSVLALSCLDVSVTY